MHNRAGRMGVLGVMRRNYVTESLVDLPFLEDGLYWQEWYTGHFRVIFVECAACQLRSKVPRSTRLCVFGYHLTTVSVIRHLSSKCVVQRRQTRHGMRDVCMPQGQFYGVLTRSLDIESSWPSVLELECSWKPIALRTSHSARGLICFSGRSLHTLNPPGPRFDER